MPAGEGRSVWTTAVDLMLYEDIMIKLGVDQDIVVQGCQSFSPVTMHLFFAYHSIGQPIGGEADE